MGNGQSSQVHYTERVLEPGMSSAWPDSGHETELLNSFKTRKGRRVDQREFWFGQWNTVVQRVADDRGYAEACRRLKVDIKHTHEPRIGAAESGRPGGMLRSVFLLR
jgi:hypothetical protein